jgi:hypothetical protein
LIGWTRPLELGVPITKVLVSAGWPSPSMVTWISGTNSGVVPCRNGWIADSASCSSPVIVRA